MNINKTWKYDLAYKSYNIYQESGYPLESFPRVEVLMTKEG